MVVQGVLLAEYGDVVVSAVHRRTHQVGRAGVQTRIFLSLIHISVEKLVRKGWLKGEGDRDGLNLSEDLLRTLVINDRAGVYGE